jgi:hypothetical protein
VLSGEPPHRGGQAAVQVERASSESGLTIACEVFCSETRLRTSNARIRWYASKTDAPASAAAAPTMLQTTVFAQGFEKNLYVNVPLGADATPQPPPAAAAAATQRQRPLRAFQFKVLQLEGPRASAVDTPESGIVVEDLEPGTTYRWRLATADGAATGRSPVVVCKALVCPADLVREPGQPPGGNRP